MQQSYYNFKPFTHTCAGLSLLFGCLLSFSASAFVYVVDSVDDAADADTSDGVCATVTDACTLRAAVQQANAWPGHDYIVLPAGTYDLSLAGRGENAAATGDLDITGDLTLRGAGPGLTIIDADGIDRVFDVIGENTRVEIAGVTLRGGLAQPQSSPNDNGVGGGIRNAGRLTLRDVVISGNVASPFGGFAGGGIWHSAPGEAISLLLERVAVTGNRADNTAIVGDSFPVSGGGIAILNGAVRINHSVISDNVAASPMDPNGAGGGGIQLNNGNLVISDSTISGNTADMFGGGIANFSGGNPQASGAVVTIERSTISGNTAYRGAGIYDEGSPSRVTNIVNSTISGNTAVPPPGFTNAWGGGIFAGKPMDLVNVTLTGNTADEGGGLYLDAVGTGGSGGTQGSASIGNSIIANQASGGNCGGAIGNISVTGPNAVGNADNCGIGGIPGDPQLAALAAGNGGPTAVHVPQGGSPAINAGSNAICPSTDQRGFPRPIGTCDIGAVETGGGVQADLALRVIDSPDPAATGGTLRYVLEMVNQGPAAANNVQASLDLAADSNFAAATPGCNQAGGTVTCGIGALAAGASATRTIDVTPTAVATLTAAAEATANESDPVPANNTGIAVTTDAYTPTDLVIETSAETTGIVLPAGGGAETTGNIEAGDTIIAGQRFTYVLTIDNTGALARNVTVYNQIPEGVSPLAGATVTVEGPAQDGRACTLAARVVTCTLGDVPEGDDVAEIRIPAMPDERGTVVNRAQANFDGTFIDATPTDEFPINIDTRADLAVAMAVSANPVAVGANLGYVISVTNNGPSNAANPRLTLALANSVTFGSVSATGWNCAHEDAVVSCTRAALNADATSVISVFVVPNATGTIAATATIAGDDPDVVPGNNTATVNTSAVTATVTQPRLSVALAANPNPGTAGSNLSFVSTVSNTGNQTAGDVTVTQTLPAGMTVVSATSGCTQDGVFVQCPLGTIIANTSATATVVVRPEAPGSITTSVIALDAAGNEEDLSDNEASITVEINPAPGSGLRSGGRCFIATAAFGSYLDPHVAHLRRFRDDYLMTHPAGAAFVALYYEVSPPIAEFISRHEALRTATRWALTPVAYAAAWPLPTGLGALLLAFLWLRRRAH